MENLIERYKEVLVDFTDLPLFDPRKRSHDPVAYRKYVIPDNEAVFYIMELKFEANYIFFWGYQYEPNGSKILSNFRLVGIQALRDVPYVKQPFTPTPVSEITEVNRLWISEKHDFERFEIGKEYMDNIYIGDEILPNDLKELKDFYNIVSDQMEQKALKELFARN